MAARERRRVGDTLRGRRVVGVGYGQQIRVRNTKRSVGGPTYTDLAKQAVREAPPVAPAPRKLRKKTVDDSV